MKLLGKVICAVTRKHRRGKAIPLAAMPARTPSGQKYFECPRCGAQWTRKARNAAV